MTRDEAQKLKLLFLATAAYYSHEVKDAALALYVEDLADLPYEAVAGALAALRRDPKTRRCPLPADIRAKLTPESDPEAEATVIAGRILAAISRIGPYNVAAARQAIGEVGWQVVEGSGGWENLCQIDNDDIGIHRAQWRSHAKALLQRGNVTPIRPALPNGKAAGGGLTRLGDILPKRDGE